MIQNAVHAGAPPPTQCEALPIRNKNVGEQDVGFMIGDHFEKRKRGLKWSKQSNIYTANLHTPDPLYSELNFISRLSVVKQKKLLQTNFVHNDALRGPLRSVMLRSECSSTETLPDTANRSPWPVLQADSRRSLIPYST